ncbi:hypothetical protein AAES_168852 [Amazona aestiva]|uniref:Uncharacterized protein n=1 Tax=Amazona aestiva TaxID=12930 RepID=A0A0Q3LR79_AMAAE|nr:hypothetical protein AAES_168852 [Amazona aestiva]
MVVEKLSPEAEPSPTATDLEGEGQAAAEPSPAAVRSIPRQPPTMPREPEPQEDAGDHAALPSEAEGEDLDSDKEQLVNPYERLCESYSFNIRHKEYSKIFINILGIEI